MRSHTFKLVSVVAIVVVALGGCSQEADAPQAMPQMPPTPVTTAQVISQSLSESKVYTGRLEAAQLVELRPRVSGYIDRVHFDEGSLVKQGDLLFSIDDREYRAEAKRLQAQLESSQAQIDLAQRDVERAQSLRDKNAISQEQLDNRNTQLTKARADLDALKAAIEIARLNLGYTQVKAPIDGRVSRANATAGNYIAAGQNVLTSLVSTGVFHAYFDVDEGTFSRLLEEGDGTINNTVLMSLVGESGYQHQGYIDFVDNQLNTSTGTIRLRARFENKDNIYTPGMFVRLQLSVGEATDVILVQEKAIATDLSTKFVYVVKEEGAWEFRPVQLGDRYGSLRVIRQGLNPGESIVISGLQRIFPGVVLAPEEKPMASEEELAALAELQSSLSSVSLDALSNGSR
jgi:multidrug efflux system membrane fusion protein